MCNWQGKQIGKKLTCISAGRIYSTDDFRETGYGTWSCGTNEVVSDSHNGWALCCSSSISDGFEFEI